METSEIEYCEHCEVTAKELIYTFPTNPAKDWAQAYEPISSLVVHTYVVEGEYYGTFDGPFFPLLEDDELRLSQPGTYPNRRVWRIGTEADVATWFNAEISDVVLAAWPTHPMVLQNSHMRAPHFSQSRHQVVDSTYTIAMNVPIQKIPVAVGEFKHCMIDATEWQSGRLRSDAQKTLSRELRGYACMYQCPQVFCFDGHTLLILQFRASKPQKMIRKDLGVDCWVLPRRNGDNGGIQLRAALYRLIAQGFRRCQVIDGPVVPVGGIFPTGREFFSGLPLWLDKQRHHPLGYFRCADIYHGSLYWGYGDEPVVDGDGHAVWDSISWWEHEDED
ncbi:hypothetical protein B0T26DRAFT_744159 [Lasiosphaeria miniovina]|uniref:Uncharacterized protein n=1 Tax=Lasiosphaeria miniovina TaxID=1954250 RepID=A0AA39ZSV4_9PEZI|nr:uncharacterized protein B0T26DRAFT_744159 [Lasiosphaeria miniovina]KAK0703002.1 hypothetical protein B0T26DRAFT_744159 [Lasiosphaeria miniovina]